MSALSQQASAVEAATRVLAGAAQKPTSRERDHLVALLKQAATTLRNLEFDEEQK